MKAVTGAQVEAEARKWIGTRYAHQGRSGSGLDCIGLPIVVRRGLGLETDEPPTDYSALPVDDAMLRHCRKHMRTVARSALQPGDVVVLQYKVALHMGIVGTYVHGGLVLLHASAWQPRKVHESPFDDMWLKVHGARVIGCFRFFEVSDE